MVNNNSKIYKIWTGGQEIYIGSTIKDYLSKRMAEHRNQYGTWLKNRKTFVSSYLLFEKYGIENCYIELLESKKCKDLNELHQLEGYYIRTLKCVNINVIVGLTLEERSVIKEAKKHIITNPVTDFERITQAFNKELEKEKKRINNKSKSCIIK